MSSTPAYFIPRFAPSGYVAGVLAVGYQRPTEFIEQINHELAAMGVRAGAVMLDMLLANGSRERRYFAMNFDGESIRFNSGGTLRSPTVDLEVWSKKAFATCPFELDLSLVERMESQSLRALLPEVLPKTGATHAAAEPLDRFQIALRGIPPAPIRRRPPGYGVDTSEKVASIIEDLSARINDVQSEDGIAYSFRHVDLALDVFDLLPEGLETVMRAFRDRGFAVSFAGSCAPGVTAVGRLTISWQC